MGFLHNNLESVADDTWIVIGRRIRRVSFLHINSLIQIMFTDKNIIKLYKTTENMRFCEEDMETVVARITVLFAPITCTLVLLFSLLMLKQVA